MRPNGSQYRQKVGDFRERLSAFARGNVPQGKRVYIDTTGSRSRVVPTRSDIERLAIYGRRRLHSVARVMALFEILRTSEKLDSRTHPVTVRATGAFWQAFKGTNDMQACHTCPALLLLDGQYPIFMTANQGLRRHIINEFADCMLMPRLVNDVDGALDDGVGWGAFENAAAEVLNDAGCSWSDATTRYVESMRLCFPEMLTILHREYRFPDTETQLRFDAMQAFYEGLFLTPVDAKEIKNFLDAVKNEMGMP
jgi:hypothetical protein